MFTPVFTAIPGAGTMASQDSDHVAITGGNISGVEISLGSIDSTPIGSIVPSTGDFTDLSASGDITLDGDLIVSTSSRIIYPGTVYGWRDNLAAFTVRGIGANDPNWSIFRDQIRAYEFSASTMKEVWANFHIDHDYAMGTVVYPHIHWCPNTTSTGVVRWGIEYTVAKGHQQASGSIFGATTTVYVEQTVGAASQYKHFIAEVSLADAIPAALLEPDSIVMARFFRDAAHANDTFPDSVFGFFGDMHYQTDRVSTLNKAPNFFS